MLTIYTDRFIPERFGAVNFGPVSLIRPKYKSDAGLHAHEAVHARQWLAMAAIGPVSAAIVYLAQIEAAMPYLLAVLLVPSLLHGILYKLVRRYRLACEVDAYQAQLAFYPDRLELLAGFLASKYDLDVTHTQAVQILKG
jgi:hypothetical protein